MWAYVTLKKPLTGHRDPFMVGEEKSLTSDHDVTNKIIMVVGMLVGTTNIVYIAIGIALACLEWSLLVVVNERA